MDLWSSHDKQFLELEAKDKRGWGRLGNDHPEGTTYLRIPNNLSKKDVDLPSIHDPVEATPPGPPSPPFI
jgi:hypothetical protein